MNNATALVAAIATEQVEQPVTEDATPADVCTIAGGAVAHVLAVAERDAEGRVWHAPSDQSCHVAEVDQTAAAVECARLITEDHPALREYVERLVSDDDAIVCPAWCAVSKDEHRAEMWQQDGDVDHRATFGWVKLSHFTRPDGTEGDDAEGPVIDTDYYGFRPDEIPQLIANLSAARTAVTGV